VLKPFTPAGFPAWVHPAPPQVEQATLQRSGALLPAAILQHSGVAVQPVLRSSPP